MTNEEISGLSDKALSESIEALIKDAQPVFVNYCNNWNDLMPLVIQRCKGIWLDNNNKDPSVQLDWVGGKKYKGMDVLSTYEIFSKVSQRTIAECLLKVLIAKENNQ